MIKTKKQPSHIEIDLTGPQGNAYFLLGTAKKLCSQLGLDWKVIKTQMTEADYEWLVQTFDYHFGDFVILYR